MHSPLRALIPVDTLLLAYRSGIFPMADKREDQDIFWVEPRDRAIIPLTGLHVSKSLRKVLRSDRFVVTLDRAFERVVRACAAPRPGQEQTWISERIVLSYCQLHRAGHAHSVECWLAPLDADERSPPQLVGGLYGVAFDQVFCGESMFSRADNASKVALAWLVALMRQAGFRLLDCQFMTDHLASMGAISMPQAMYLKALGQARGNPRLSLAQAYEHFSAPDYAMPERQPPQLAAASSPGKRIAQSFTQTS
ncbi:MAG: leucyl/phenylalanyl-tRNA--protein transferase [Pseudomonadota bacterium]